MDHFRQVSLDTYKDSNKVVLIIETMIKKLTLAKGFTGPNEEIQADIDKLISIRNDLQNLTLVQGFITRILNEVKDERELDD